MYILFGIDKTTIITTEFLKTLVLEDDLLETIENLKYNISDQKEQIDLLHRRIAKQGRIKKVNERLRCYYDEEGKLISIIGVCLDLSYNNMRDYSTRLNNEKFYRFFCKRYLW